MYLQFLFDLKVYVIQKRKEIYTISSSIKKKYKQNELKTLHHYVHMSGSGR